MIAFRWQIVYHSWWQLAHDSWWQLYHDSWWQLYHDSWWQLNHDSWWQLNSLQRQDKSEPNSEKFRFETDGQTDRRTARQNTSAGVELCFAAKNLCAILTCLTKQSLDAYFSDQSVVSHQKSLCWSIWLWSLHRLVLDHSQKWTFHWEIQNMDT